jgi:hypothetical protein
MLSDAQVKEWVNKESYRINKVRALSRISRVLRDSLRDALCRIRTPFRVPVSCADIVSVCLQWGEIIEDKARDQERKKVEKSEEELMLKYLKRDHVSSVLHSFKLSAVFSGSAAHSWLMLWLCVWSLHVLRPPSLCLSASMVFLPSLNSSAVLCLCCMLCAAVCRVVRSNEK